MPEPQTARLRIAVVIPAWNEEESIDAVLAELRRHAVHRIIVADGGSHDATVERAQAAGAEVLHPGPGYGRACLKGAEAAADCAIIVFMDGDGADDPANLWRLVAPVAAGETDFALGSRWRGRAAKGSMAWHQHLAGLLLGFAIWLRYGQRYTDMCAFRVIRRDLLLDLDMREMTYGWNIEMQMKVAAAGLRVVELPVDNRRRIGGASKVAGSLKGSLKAGWRILRTFCRVAASPHTPRNKAMRTA
ncbi:MAG TPA: glycosyltransferase family 2 protein [Stellaceae bacterium]|jgi:glycosyltransferase involved in cell wall biosynthesis|nr:glycosyltransferase family 2 protein [Stellaceae bacterium]